MKLVMVTNNALEDKVGGHERYVRELSSTLSRRGIDVTIVAKRWRADSPGCEQCSDGVTIDRYAVPTKSNPLYALAYPFSVSRGVWTRAAPRDGHTVVHVHMGVPGLPLAVRGTPFVFTFHAPVWRELLSERQESYVLPNVVQEATVRVLRRAESLVARRASNTVVLSEYMRNELARLDESAAHRATVLPGGIDTDRFSPADGELASTPPEGPVLFTARILTPRTGVDELIRAMPAIAAAAPGVRLKVAGTGAMETELRAIADELGVGQAVEFLGRLGDEALVDWYRRATLVVLPTREFEGFGLMTAEALACGAAVVGTPAGATPELLRALDRDLITDDVSAESIAATVVRLLAAPERLTRIRERAAQRVVPSMAWDHIADAYVDLYERLV
jgi:glycosyltransferase involved in cell wall biosynthesis